MPFYVQHFNSKETRRCFIMNASGVRFRFDSGAGIVFHCRADLRAARIPSKLLGNHPIKSYFQLRSFGDCGKCLNDSSQWFHRSEGPALPVSVGECRFQDESTVWVEISNTAWGSDFFGRKMCAQLMCRRRSRSFCQASFAKAPHGYTILVTPFKLVFAYACSSSSLCVWTPNVARAFDPNSGN